MTTSETQNIDLDLIQIGNQLSLTAKGLQQQATNNVHGVLISTDLLSGKIPNLKKLGSFNIFKMRKVDNRYKCDTISLFVNDDGEVGIYSPDFQELKDFDCLSYKTGFEGHAVIEHKSGVILKVSISVSDDHSVEIAQNGEPFEGDGLPLPPYLKLVPRPETPLYDNSIPHNKVLTIISNGKKTRKFDTPLVTIESESGEVFKDVIANAAVQRIYEEHGIGSKFKIAGKHPKKNKGGSPVNANGEVSEDKHAWIVDIIDCQAPQFDDL